MRTASVMFAVILLSMTRPVWAGLPEQIATIPEACEQLTQSLAVGVLGAPVKPLSSNEHIPTFYSQCEYRRTSGQRGHLQFVFKFLALERFDVERLPPSQLDFSVSFAVGGLSHSDKKPFPGKMTYVFHDRHDTIVFMITEVAGPRDGAGQDTVLVASFRLTDSERSPAQRLEQLKPFPWQLLKTLLGSSAP
ncbi:hypothetical protein [Parahaliea mediterranea]|uniref:hypothetical protein n=1 Tax=Parahaliea mediterranea TaxID=651086 RepID=UPI000E2EE54C|nr:hypothetical protein [Parahaliea mediterranea]